MPTDHIRYDILAQEALRGVVRTVLADAAKKGLPGEHHFKITFATPAPGVRLSDRMRAQYPRSHDDRPAASILGLDRDRRRLRSRAVVRRRAGAAGGAVRCHNGVLRSGGAIRLPVRNDRCRGGGRAGHRRQPGRETCRARVSRLARRPRPSPRRCPAPPLRSRRACAGANGGGGGEVVRLDRFRKK